MDARRIIVIDCPSKRKLSTLVRDFERLKDEAAYADQTQII